MSVIKKITTDDFETKHKTIIHPAMGYMEQCYHILKEPIGGYNVTIDCVIGGYELKIYREGLDNEFSTKHRLDFYKDNYKNKEELKVALFKKLNEWI